tara:strand:- start:1375 stop:2226 length:852 start_codon:yes stop_codon:yes gene_type:complete
MNWITNFVRPKLQAIVGKKEVPDNLWETCNNCGQMLLKRELIKNLFVCKSCDNHMRMTAEQRLNLILNPGFTLIDTPHIKVDPLRFKDKKKYSERLKDSQKKCDRHDTILLASGFINKNKVIVAVFDFSFMGGSMGMAAGEAIVKAANCASDQNCPLIIISASGGARMQEGILALMQMPRTIIAINSLEKKKLPYVSILTDPTTGGVSASFAMLGDIIIAEEGAIIGFAGTRVIEETIKEKIPQNFQKSNYLKEKGMVDIVVHRKDLKTTVSKIIKHLSSNLE